MFVVRPARAADIPALLALTAAAGPGVHTLPRTEASTEQAVARSLAAFAADPESPGEESYLFVLEAANGDLVGTATILATAGARGTYFAFRRDVLHQVSRDLDVSHSVEALTLSSALTSCSQLSGFHLRRRRGAGIEAALLSRARLLFAAGSPQRFAERFFASMAGLTDAGGRSPFWEALGRKFFNMDFLEAERLIEGARNRTLIVELMPHYPVYVPLLPQPAQQALGQLHPDARLPCTLLTAEGFAADEFVDLFDGGPVLQAQRSGVRAFVDSARSHVATRVEGGEAGGLGRRLISNAREQDFRAVIVECPRQHAGELVLDEAAQRALDVVAGDPLLYLDL